MFYCFHNSTNSDMDYGILNVRTDVTACVCARGCTDTVKESALKVDSGRKIPRCTGESNLRRRRAGSMLSDQLSYIPYPTHVTHVCMCVCACACVYVTVRVCVHACVCAHLFLCACKCVHTCVCLSQSKRLSSCRNGALIFFKKVLI